jgi:hypothetical protein
MTENFISAVNFVCSPGVLASVSKFHTDGCSSFMSETSQSAIRSVSMSAQADSSLITKTKWPLPSILVFKQEGGWLLAGRYQKLSWRKELNQLAFRTSCNILWALSTTGSGLESVKLDRLFIKWKTKDSVIRISTDKLRCCFYRCFNISGDRRRNADLHSVG